MYRRCICITWPVMQLTAATPGNVDIVAVL